MVELSQAVSNFKYFRIDYWSTSIASTQKFLSVIYEVDTGGDYMTTSTATDKRPSKWYTPANGTTNRICYFVNSYSSFYFFSGYASGSTNNAGIIPMAIYGLK